jgi:stage II sporulation protein D
MPHDWPSEAQKAQAVAARSYALASRTGPGGLFDVFGDTRSQVYGGIAAETPEGLAAVAATKGRVLLYAGKVAWTYFYSSSGGRTADLVDEWPDAEPMPYLRSVADPYDPEVSPYREWTVAVPAERVARALKVPGRVLELAPTPSASGRLKTIVAVGERGEKEVRGADFRFALGLRSTWLRVGTVSLDRPAAPLVLGSALRLTGSVRGVDAPVLEQRARGGTWAVVGPLRLAADGRFAVTVQPQLTTDYRISAPGAPGTAVRVAVSPEVSLGAAAGAPGVTGIAAARPGAAVELQREDDLGAWKTVRRGRVDADGTFAFPFELAAGAYRARVAAGGGLAAGLSAVLEVGG